MTTRTGRRGGTLRFALDEEAYVFAPWKSCTYADFHVMSAMYDTLLKMDHDLQIRPHLVQEWELISNTLYRMRLRPDVLFHDGTLLTVEQVLWSLQTYLGEESAIRSNLSVIREIRALDDLTFEVALHEPYSPLLAQFTSLAGMVLSPQTTRVQAGQDQEVTFHVGTGPFQMVQKADTGIFLQRFDRYWELDKEGIRLPYADALEMPCLPNGSKMLERLEAGELSLINEVPYAQVPALQEHPEVDFLGIPAHGFNAVRLNMLAAPFAKKELRQAVAFAIDREEMLRTINLGVGIVSHGPIPPGSWAYDAAFRPYSYQPNRVQELLEQAGCPDGFAFTLLIPSEPMLTMTQHMAEQMRRCNIHMNIEVVKFPKLIEKLLNHDFQAIFLGAGGGTDADELLFNLFHSAGSENYCGYTNPEVDELLLLARREADQNKRIALYRNIQELICEDSPFLFTRSGLSMIAKRKEIQDVSPHINSAIDWKKIWIRQ